MKRLFEQQDKLLVGVVHLPPLPGAPRWKGSLESVVNHAIVDATALDRGGAHALILENFGDMPFSPGPVGPETWVAVPPSRAARKPCTMAP